MGLPHGKVFSIATNRLFRNLNLTRLFNIQTYYKSDNLVVMYTPEVE